jgi:cell wall-associated NlpC family hydrolase
MSRELMRRAGTTLVAMTGALALVAAEPATADTALHPRPAAASPQIMAISARTAAKAMELAHTRIGKPYRWGAAGPNAFDCSGLVYWSYGRVGVRVVREVNAQRVRTRAIARSRLRPGDLIFYPNHVAIFKGGNSMIEAFNSRTGVRVTSIRGGVIKYGTYR